MTRTFGRQLVRLAATTILIATVAGATDAGVNADIRPSPIDVSLVELIARPERFDGKLVRVLGFCWLEFEQSVLYLHEEDFVHSLSRNAIWIELEGNTIDTKGLSGRYALFEGVFNANSHGHLSMTSGSLERIVRAKVWVNPRPVKSTKTRP